MTVARFQIRAPVELSADGYASTTENQAREALRLWCEGVTQAEIRRRVNVSKAVIWNIVHRRSWAWLP